MSDIPEESKTPSSIEELSELVQRFRDARDWKQFHNPKDMVISLFLEVSELAEHLQWKSEEEFASWLEENRGDFAEELADILYWVLLIARDTEIDLSAAFKQKMEKNSAKYPVERARGRKDKYTAYNKP